MSAFIRLFKNNFKKGKLKCVCLCLYVCVKVCVRGGCGLKTVQEGVSIKSLCEAHAGGDLGRGGVAVSPAQGPVPLGETSPYWAALRGPGIV